MCSKFSELTSDVSTITQPGVELNAAPTPPTPLGKPQKKLFKWPGH